MESIKTFTVEPGFYPAVPLNGRASYRDYYIPKDTECLYWLITDALPVELPPGLKYLYCPRVDVVKTLFPDSLIHLECNSARYVECHLPPNLEVFIANLAIMIFQSQPWPEYLRVLEINSIQSIIQPLPLTLERLMCDRVRELPKLHEGIKFLRCNNVLVFSNGLPDSIEYLHAASLIELPAQYPRDLKYFFYDPRKIKKQDQILIKLKQLLSFDVVSLLNLVKTK